MSAIDLHRIRLFVNTRDLTAGLTEDLTGNEPVIAHGGDVGFEVFLADGAYGGADTTAVSVGDISSLSVAVMPQSRSGDALMARGSTTLVAKDVSDFDSGEPTDCHVQIRFTYAETQILEDGQTDEARWLIIYGYVAGGRKIFGCGAIRVIRPGVPDNALGDLAGAAGRFHEGQQQLVSGGSWYALSVVTGGTTPILTISQTPFDGSFVLGATGSAWGIGDGQIWWYTGSAWQAIIATVVDDVLMLALSDTTSATTPNGELTGTNYRVTAGLAQARHPSTGYWHSIEIHNVDGALSVAWSTTYSQV